jgi:predicted Zn-dependent protease
MVLRPLIVAAFLCALVSCAVNPATGKRELSLMSEAQEIGIGTESDPQIKQEMGVYNDADLQQYVNTIGQQIAKQSERPNLPWRFTVVDQPAINAFAVPGGFIYLTRGILPFLENEAELVGVIGHEIGHITARHSAQQYTRTVGGTVGLLALGIFVPQARPLGDLSQQALGVLFLKYGRDDELQADGLGARYAVTHGWDPAGVPGMLSTLGRLDEANGDRKGIPNWLSTHPEPLLRVKEIEPDVQKLKAGRTDLRTDRDALLRRLDGIVYGDNPEQGIVRGTTFLHPPLRFRIDFPQGWQVQNSASQVAAKAPDADVFMVLQLVQQPQGRNIEEIAAQSMQKAGFRTVSGETTTIGGQQAFVGVYEGVSEQSGTIGARAAHISYGTNVFVIAGLAQANAFRQADTTFLSSIRSFRTLSASEAENIRPSRIDLYVVRAGDTWQSLAEQSKGAIPAATLAIMNQSSPSTPPRAGARIKIVVGG